MFIFWRQVSTFKRVGDRFMDAASVRLVVNIKAVVASVVLAALLFAGFAATFGFAPSGSQFTPDRPAMHQASGLSASTTPRPAALAADSAQAVAADTTAADAATAPDVAALSLPHKPVELAPTGKRRARHFESASPVASMPVASVSVASVASAPQQHGKLHARKLHLQDVSVNLDAVTARIARTTKIATVAVVLPDQVRDMTDRIGSEAVSQHADFSPSVFDNPTELHPLSAQELAAVSAANGVVGLAGGAPVT